MMEVETQKIDRDNVTLALKQTSKGYWYVDKLSVTRTTDTEVFDIIDAALKSVNERLDKLNKHEE